MSYTPSQSLYQHPSSSHYPLPSQPQRRHQVHLPPTSRRPSFSYQHQHQHHSHQLLPLPSSSSFLLTHSSHPHSFPGGGVVAYEYALSSDRTSGESGRGGWREDERGARGGGAYSGPSPSPRGGAGGGWHIAVDEQGRMREGWNDHQHHSNADHHHPHQHSSSLSPNSFASSTNHHHGDEHESHLAFGSSSSSFAPYPTSAVVPYQHLDSPFLSPTFDDSPSSYSPTLHLRNQHNHSGLPKLLTPPPALHAAINVHPLPAASSSSCLVPQRPTYLRQDSFDQPSLAPLLSPSGNSILSSRSISTNISTPSSTAPLTTFTRPRSPPSSALFQVPEGFVGFASSPADENEQEHGLRLSFPSAEEEQQSPVVDEEPYYFGDEADFLEGEGGSSSRGLVSPQTEGLVDLELGDSEEEASVSGAGAGAGGTKKRKADEEVEKEGQKWQYAKVGVEYPPGVPLTKSGKPRKKKGKAIVACEECRRLKMRCDNKFPCSSCVTRGCPSICPTGTLANLRGKRLVLSDTVDLHDRITQLETALALSYAREHPSWSSSSSSFSRRKGGKTSAERVHPLLVKEKLVPERDSKAK